jgi:hypothetical protein
MVRSKPPKVTVGIPVFNGENFLEQAITSFLSQTLKDFELIISDNASSDDTDQIIRTYAKTDPRIRHYRNDHNVGSSKNYTRVFEEARGQYFKWAAHDDCYAPTYLENCVAALDADPSLVLCTSLTRDINAKGAPILGKPYSPDLDLNSYEIQTRFRAALRVYPICYVWGLMPRAVLAQTRLLGDFLGHDKPLLTRLSLMGRFYTINEELFFHRQHDQRSAHKIKNQQVQQAILWFDSQKKGQRLYPHWRLFKEHAQAIRQVPMSFAERWHCIIELVGYFLQRDQAISLADDIFQAFETPSCLGRGFSRLRAMNKQRRWRKMVRRARTEISCQLGNERIVLIDQEKLRDQLALEQGVVPFTERDGTYWGPPESDSHAIKELERKRKQGLHTVVFCWPAFWWLEYYEAFGDYLKTHFDVSFKSALIQIYRAK